MKTNIEETLHSHLKVIEELLPLSSHIETIGNLLRDTLLNQKKIMFIGNGGSAADTQHIAAEIVGRFESERRGLPAIALTTDSSVLTSIANDYGFESVFSRQVEAIGQEGDILVAISTSGESYNILKAIGVAKTVGITTFGLLGKSGGEVADAVDHKIIVPSNNTARIQEAHILIGHILCQIIDEGIPRP